MASTLTLKDLISSDKTENSIWVTYPSGAAERFERDGNSWAAVDDNGQKPTEEESEFIQTDEQVEELWARTVDLSGMR